MISKFTPQLTKTNLASKWTPAMLQTNNVSLRKITILSEEANNKKDVICSDTTQHSQIPFPLCCNNAMSSGCAWISYFEIIVYYIKIIPYVSVHIFARTQLMNSDIIQINEQVSNLVQLMGNPLTFQANINQQTSSLAHFIRNTKRYYSK